jgi:large subunit ribosomal protein L25
VPEVKINAERRTEFGKGAARRTRRAGQVPGVIYGHGSDPAHVALPGHDLMQALRTPNVLLRVAVDGDSLLTLPKQVQRDPVRHTLEHVDLVIVRSGEKVTIDVPVTVEGRVVGGLVELVVAAVSLEAEATHIPSQVLVDVDGREIGTTVRAGDLVLPQGTTLAADPDQIIVSILAPQAEEEPVAEAEGEGAVEGEGAEGGEAPEASADEG